MIALQADIQVCAYPRRTGTDTKAGLTMRNGFTE
jgi:hypothetical protein